MAKPLFTGTEWTLDLVEKMWEIIEDIGKNTFKLDFYPARIEIVSNHQMLDNYCLAPDHKVLTTDLRWVPLRDIKNGDIILGFDEELRPGKYRQYAQAVVLSHHIEKLPCYRVTLASGKEFIATGEHRWLTKKDNVTQGHHQSWRTTNELDANTYTFKLLDTWEESYDRGAAYLAGLFDGEASILSSGKKLSVAQNPGPVQEKIESLCNTYSPGGFTVCSRSHDECLVTLINGNMADRLKFLGTIRPERLINKLNFDEIGTVYTTRFSKDYIVSVEAIGEHEVAVVKTSTGTMVVDGYPMHNCSNALPVMYNHWSFGKQFISYEHDYKKKNMPLAYEVVINTNPALSYLCEDNTAMMQCLTLAHAACGHASFFKNNYLFKEWTNASSIITYLKFAQGFIKQCEQKYGHERVEGLLDAAHALQYNSIDKYKKPTKKEVGREEKWDKYEQENFNDLWRTVATKKDKKKRAEERNDFHFPEENLLYFIEKHGRHLQDWEKEILRIVRKISQYFYPQMQTKLMNEGWASYWHYKIMNELHVRGHIDDGTFLEFLSSHTSVLCQRDFSTLNPYAIGFAIFMDIERICKEPTEEDKQWFPELIGKDWLAAVHEAMENYRDESFVSQYLSPKVIRDLKLCTIFDEEAKDYVVSATSADEDVLDIRSRMSDHYNVNLQLPHIEVVGFDKEDSDLLYLHNYEHNGRRLDKQSLEAFDYFKALWKDPVALCFVDPITGKINETI